MVNDVAHATSAREEVTREEFTVVTLQRCGVAYADRPDSGRGCLGGGDR
jgi:hypothetical protein